MMDARFLAREDLQLLFDLLKDGGYTIHGPRVADGTIGFAPLSTAQQLPWGVQDEQEAGRYRLADGPANRAFLWTTAALTLKSLAFPPTETLWQVKRGTNGGLAFTEVTPPGKPIAVIGARACDLAALDLQDRHFHAKGDPWYRVRRDRLFVAAVNCARSTATCFCSSTGDGPAVNASHDLLLDELEDGFIVRHGSQAGASLLANCGWEPAVARHLAEADAQTQAAAEAQTRELPHVNLENELWVRANANTWNGVGDQCLACGNCTAVCPSCFCHRHTEEPNLDGSVSTHGREWDSCFNDGHSVMHGHPHRRDITHRYRQWLSHKLGYWHEQFGRSGCTGCGRCITWCPVGIDITETVASLMLEVPR